MMKLIATSMIIVGTFASIGTASADTVYIDGYNGWASQAFDRNSAS